MREHRFIRHSTSTKLVAISGFKNKARKLKSVRKHGMWAFVDIPAAEDEICEVHYWHRADQPADQVALMIAHELGHIADGGPKDHVIGDAAEEDRADEFARAAWEAVKVVIASGMLADPRKRVRRSPDDDCDH